MNVMHLHRAGNGLVFIDFNADVVGSGKKPLSHCRIVYWFPLQSRCFPPGDRLIEILHVKSKGINGGSYRATVIVLLAQQNIDPGKLDHHELFPVDDLSANLRPELLLDGGWRKDRKPGKARD